MSERPLPHASDFAEPLAAAQTDEERCILVSMILDAYRAPVEAVISHYATAPVIMRTVVTVRMTRSVHTYGFCRFHRNRNDICEMSFSRHIFFPGNEQNLINIVVHEMLHACLPYEDGHGTHFRFFARKLNAALGTHVTVYSDTTVVRTGTVHYRYEVVCTACGNASRYLRAGKVVKQPYLYHCAKCGAHALMVRKLS